MEKRNNLALACLTFALLISACASQRILEAPDTSPGDQLEHNYMIGNWCTNRELTGETNRDAGHSGLSHMRPLFWSFKQGGAWQVSVSGWLYESQGKWRIKGLDTLVLERSNEKPVDYEANFKDSDLYLKDKEGEFLVLSGCE